VAFPTNSTGCSTGEYVAGASINLSGAMADNGWQISSWAGTANDNSTTSTNSLIMPASAHTAGVNYTQITHNLTLAVDPDSGGTTTPPAGEVHTYTENAGVPIAATPADGYVFDHWEGDVANPNMASTTVTMDEDKTVTAYFTLAPAGVLGDVNGDDLVNSTDALIILSCDVGMDTSSFCPMNCGDVNADGFANSTDALIILSYEVGMDVPYPVGGPGCPSSVAPGPGCNP